MPLALFARSTHLIYLAAKFVGATPHYLEVFGGGERAWQMCRETGAPMTPDGARRESAQAMVTIARLK